MPQVFHREVVRSVMAGLMACLLLALGLFACNEEIHARLHDDSPATHGACSVCALAKGQLDTPILSHSFVVVALRLSWTLPPLESLSLPTSDFSVASSRGPPAFIAFV